MPYTPPSGTFIDNVEPVGSGDGLALGADFFNALVEGVEDADTRIAALEASPGAVSSVNGASGAVVLAKADVGLGAVDNTSDAAKPVSTATQSALAGKVSSATITTIVALTQAAYDALTPDPATLYVVTG